MDLVQQSFKTLNKGKLDNGLFVAAPSDDYWYVWMRDNVMISFAFLRQTCDTYERIYWRWLDMLIEYEEKLTHHTKVAPKVWFEHIHARFSAEDVKEINTPWSHAQNDAVGGLLFGIGEGIKVGKKMLRNEKDKEIVQKVVLYLATMKYWKKEDAGAWEEGLELRTSSIAACVAGLRNVSDIVCVPDLLIDNGMDALYELFPYETRTRKQDLAQLTAIYPYRVFGDEMSKIILENVEKNLLRKNGVLRYQLDSYYSTLGTRDLPLDCYVGTEAEWTFGFGYLAIAWTELGDYDKARKYLELFESVANEKGEFPELYLANGIPNKNTPLLWSHAVYIVAHDTVNVKNWAY